MLEHEQPKLPNNEEIIVTLSQTATYNFSHEVTEPVRAKEHR